MGVIQNLSKMRASFRSQHAQDDWESKQKAVSLDKALEKMYAKDEANETLKMRQAWNTLENLKAEHSKKSDAISNMNILLEQMGGKTYIQKTVDSTVAFGELGDDLGKSLDRLKSDASVLNNEISVLSNIISKQAETQHQLKTMKEFYRTVPTLDVFGTGDKIDREDVSAGAFLQQYPHMPKAMAQDMAARYALPSSALEEANLQYQERILAREDASKTRKTAGMMDKVLPTLNSKFASEYNVLMNESQEAYNDESLKDEAGNRIKNSTELRAYVGRQVVKIPFIPLPTSPYAGHETKGSYPMARFLIDMEDLSFISENDKNYTKKVNRLASYGIDMYSTATNKTVPNPGKLTELGELLQNNYEWLGQHSTQFDQSFYREGVIQSFGLDPKNIDALIDPRYAKDYKPNTHVIETIRAFQYHKKYQVAGVLNALSNDESDPGYDNYMGQFKELNQASTMKYRSLKEINIVPILTKELLSEFKDNGVFNKKEYTNHTKNIGKSMNELEFFAHTLNSLKKHYEIGE